MSRRRLPAGASPHVAAVAGLAFATHAGWGPGDVRSRLKDSAKYIGPRQSFGAGMVDADAASW